MIQSMPTLDYIVSTCSLKFLQWKEALSETRRALRTGFSAVTQSISVTNEAKGIFNRTGQVHAMPLDFSKFFVGLLHLRLLHKLCVIRAPLWFMRWISPYLHNCKQFASIDGNLPGVLRATSGVPLGPVLSPLLFLVHVDELAELLVHGIRSVPANCTPFLYHVQIIFP